jgi:glyoxylase-like metal-dependent hydrolase (beta-lactamase superfamily II)
VLVACRDDIGDHDKWAKYYNCKRILHSSDVRPHITDIETQLQGSGPWNLSGDTFSEQELDNGVIILHTPGHSKGCVTLWHEATKTMFTGDHIAYSGRLNRLTLFPLYNHDDMRVQIKSAEKLLDWDVMHLLPGHGRRYHFKDAAERLQMFSGAIEPEMAKA